MKFKIPFTSGDFTKLKSRSKLFSSKFKHKKNSKLETLLRNLDIDLTREEYLGIVLYTFVNLFVIAWIVLSLMFLVMQIKLFYLIGAGIAIVLAGFNAITQLGYPGLFQSKRQKNIDKNLLFAMDDMLVQLNSGVALFEILTNISNSNYGELSVEFKKIVKRISAGEPESKVLNDVGKKNSSVFFRRILWQLSNGLNSGSNMTLIIKESVNTLNEEQMIQIQNYGNKLNPLIMMYMLISVIVPALSVSFMTVVVSMMGVEETIAKSMFIGLFIFVLFFQIMFLGMIRSKRPSLL
ncbi:type II secretion system F family protein [Candidatus Pacearchaeota archaeon]|nr:type II secretion system F family protein [Candidatus Pacearchaeota archaeon]